MMANKVVPMTRVFAVQYAVIVVQGVMTMSSSRGLAGAISSGVLGDSSGFVAIKSVSLAFHKAYKLTDIFSKFLFCSRRLGQVLLKQVTAKNFMMKTVSITYSCLCPSRRLVQSLVQSSHTE